MKAVCGIYKITNPKGKVYIGQSTNIYKTFKNRYGNCVCYSQRLIYNSIKKYGWNNHKAEILHLCEWVQLNELEIYYSKLFNSTNRRCGLNIRECGGSSGAHSEETKKKISSSNKKTYQNPELKERMRQISIGRTASEETKKKISDAHIGKKHKPESLKKMSIASSARKYPNRKYTYTEEQRVAMSVLHRGKKMSPEAIEKTRQANIGKKHSEETKRKLSEHFKGKKIAREIVEKNCKIILNLETGIFYIGAKEVSIQMMVSELTASRRLSGYLINNTSFIYV